MAGIEVHVPNLGLLREAMEEQRKRLPEIMRKAFVRALARSTDPRTSHAAAHSMSETAAHHATLIIGALQRPATATEIAQYAGLDAVQVCRRLTELERLKIIRPTGLTRKTASGRQSRVWERVKP